jgi:uncharacterized RDD family membrane protein YckC
MSASAFKRILSFLVDFVLILGLVTFSYRVIARPMIENGIENFDTLYAGFYDAQADRIEAIVLLQESLENGLITETEYAQEVALIDTFYNENYAEETLVFAALIYQSIIYYLVSASLANYLYNLVFKGKTVGRKISKLRLSGNVTWWTLLLRELLWKPVYWIFTLGFGIFLDFIMIALTSSKKTLRDYVSKTRVVVEDTLYPI